MIAHVHGDAAMYFAHNGVWVRLMDYGNPANIVVNGTYHASPGGNDVYSCSYLNGSVKH